MGKTIEAGEIRVLDQKYRDATLPYEKEALRRKLDAIANGLEACELSLDYEDNPELEDTFTLLAGFGEELHPVYYALALREFPSPPEQPQYLILRGMNLLGLPYKDVTRIAASLQRGKFPSDVVDDIVNHQEEIKRLHPDKYPFGDTAYDDIAIGLNKAGINTEKVWRGIEKNLTRRGRTDLALMYGYETPTHALTGFLAHYALTKHDIAELDQTKREIHF